MQASARLPLSPSAPGDFSRKAQEIGADDLQPLSVSVLEEVDY